MLKEEKEPLDKTLCILHEKQCGFMTDLVYELGQEEVIRVIQLNWIKTYLRHDGIETWRITEEGIKMYKLFCCEPTFKEKVLGWFCYYFLRMNNKSS